MDNSVPFPVNKPIAASAIDFETVTQAWYNALIDE